MRPAYGQSAGPFIPLGSRLDRLAVWAIEAGALPALDPLTRPFRFGDVRRASERVDTAGLAPAARRAAAWLRDEVASCGDSTALVAEVGIRAYRNGRRDSFRTSDSGGVSPAGGLRVVLARGPIVAVVNPAFENRLKDDPEYTGYTPRLIAGRMQEAYIAYTADRGDLFYGRIARNWGPALFDGLLLSPSAYATDELAGRLRIGRFELLALGKRLDDRDTTAVVPYNRWFLAHRLSVDAGRGVWLALSETGVYGGPGQPLNPLFHAPLNVALLSGFNDGPANLNSLVGADALIPIRHGARLGLSLYLDDISIDRKTLTDRRPTAYGVTAVLTAALPSEPVHLTLGYTRVSSLAYRNSFDPKLEYSVLGVGIARNFSDYDQVLVRIDMQPSPAWWAVLDLSYLRQGAADFRQPFPPDSVLAQRGQGFLVAPVSRTPGARFAVAGTLGSGVTLRGELGATRTPGGATEPIAAVGVRLRFDVLRGRLDGAWAALEEGATRPWP